MLINHKIIIFCQTIDFQNFTRRSTIEAIGKLNNNTTAVCMIPIWKKGKANLKSEIMEVLPFYTFFPLKFLKFELINRLNFNLNNLLIKRKLEGAEIQCFTSSHQSFLISILKKKTKIFVLSDPYHLMGNSKGQEREMIQSAKYIFATSKALANNYINKYFENALQRDTVVHYWPNCVDPDIWNIEKVRKVQAISNNCENKQITVGFAGNFMMVTDVDLLEGIISRFPHYRFVLAGKNNLQKGSNEYYNLLKIFSYDNVEYKGYIPYEMVKEEVYSWDIGIMIDKMDELASYHHHNKLYQYFALGKPVVYQLNHQDHLGMKDVAFGAKGLEEFCSKLEFVAKNIIEGSSFEKEAVQYAHQNSNLTRAKYFLETINNKFSHRLK